MDLWSVSEEQKEDPEMQEQDIKDEDGSSRWVYPQKLSQTNAAINRIS